MRLVMNKLTSIQQRQIYQAINLEDNKKIVLLDVLGIKHLSEQEANRNIYYIDNDYNVIWQIDPEPTKFNIDSFTSIKIDGEGIVQARKFSGFEYEVDKKTGKAEITGWNK